MPAKVRKTIGKRTVARRLADKGYVPEVKINKTDPDVRLAKKREKFGKKYLHWDGDTWKSELQGVADFKDFTYYPPKLRPRFARLRARWTYMNKNEKRKPAFCRPKKWFPKKHWETTRKQKVFGMTTSTGQSLSFLVPSLWSTEEWAKKIKKH